MRKIFALLVLLSLFHCKKDHTLKIETETESGSSVSLRNYKRLGYSKEGELVWSLKAKESFIYSNQNRTIFYEVHFEQYDKDKLKSILTAGKGDLDNLNKILKLSGGVHVSTTEDKKEITTDTLEYNLEDKSYFTDDEVHVVTNGTTIHGIGLKGNKEENTFTILKPTAITRGGSNPLLKKNP